MKDVRSLNFFFLPVFNFYHKLFFIFVKIITKPKFGI